MDIGTLVQSMRSKTAKIALGITALGAVASSACGTESYAEQASPTVSATPTPAYAPPVTEVPNPVLFVFGYADKLDPGQKVWTQERWEEAWHTNEDTFTVIEGVTTDAQFVNYLRSKGRVFAYHVVNPYRSCEVGDLHALVDDWVAPFSNTLDGKLPGGFDAIAIDEIVKCPDNTPGSEFAASALKELRRRINEDYPNKMVFVAGVWNLGDGGPTSTYGDPAVSYDTLLNAINNTADIFFLERYAPASNPQYNLFVSMGANITRIPGLLDKTIFGLYIAQSSEFNANDNPDVDFFKFLESQARAIRTNPDLQPMPGIGVWNAYLAEPDTIDAISQIITYYWWDDSK